MWYLRQSTASQEIALGPFVDDTDGKTAETGLTIANTDIKIQKCGATTLASKNSGGATHISNGNYYAVLDATDTDTLGSGRVIVQVSGALPVWIDFVVLSANIYDSMILGTDLFDVSVTQWNGTNVATPDAAGYPKITIKSGTGTGEIVLSSGNVGASSVAGNVLGSVGSVTNATTIASSVASVMASSPVGSVTSGVTLADGAITAAKIATDAITDAKVASDVTIASVTGNVGGIGANGITSTSLAASAITAIQSGLSTLTSNAVAAAVLDTASNGHTTSGTIGDRIHGTFLACMSKQIYSTAANTISTYQTDGTTLYKTQAATQSSGVYTRGVPG